VLAAGQRLRRSSEFAAAIRAGRRAGRGSVVVHLTEPPTEDTPARTGERPPARAGFVVSRAVGGAVVRNAVRRRLRHLVHERLAALPPGTTLVVRALPAAATASYRQLGMDLDGALAAARARGGRDRRDRSTTREAL
jgi:ribonuclease P protein component